MILLVFTGASLGQPSRNSWKLKLFDLDKARYTLEKAPLTSDERDQLYRAIDSDVRENFGAANHAEERKAILSFLVSPLHLSKDGQEGFAVRGTKEFCGATGNCSLWIFVRQKGRLRTALDAEAQFLIIEDGFTRGVHDITLGLHDSAFIHEYMEYRWDGSAYKEVDCYLVEYPVDGGTKSPPAIISCQ